VNVAVAASPDAAFHAARGCHGVKIIDAGKESLTLACLPIAVLDCGRDKLERLYSWGIHNLKELADLDDLSIAQRLGQKGILLQRLARCERQRELIPFEPVAHFEESIDLEQPCDLFEPVVFLAKRLLNRLITRLTMRSFATDRLRLDIKLERHSNRQSLISATAPVHKISLKLPVPTQDEQILLRLLQLRLSEHPPQAPVKKITLEAEPAQIRFGQTNLFEPRALDRSQLEVTLAKLRAVVGRKDCEGRDRVGFSSITDSHKRDSCDVMPSCSTNERTKSTPPHVQSQYALRRLRPPERAKVTAGDEIPSEVVVRRKRSLIEGASGPWHNSGEWWDNASEWSHDTWDVGLSSPAIKGLSRIIHDRRSAEWFIEGFYD
jgi:protein ImuB